CLKKDKREQLFKYMWGIFKNNNCHLYRINGVEDHIHIITHIHSTVALSSFEKDIKTASSVWIKQEEIFPAFESWQIGYAAFTYSIDSKDDLIEYAKNQEKHHQKQSFINELKELLMKHEKARIFHEGIQKLHFFMKYAG
ncbi:MAG: transposase, partial [Candidatus Marinimicrobia bacterium]|nr:transposase [Candidatus Neomarinimicrobiota bacterium]